MKTILLCLFTLAATTTIAQANRAVFAEIAEEASVANGSAEVTKYDTSLTKAQLQEQGKKELAERYWENCGPWKVITSRREALKQITELENMVEKTTVAEKLQALYDKNEIFALVAAVSNNEVECSLTWVNIYGADGSKLELRYNVGD